MIYNALIRIEIGISGMKLMLQFFVQIVACNLIFCIGSFVNDDIIEDELIKNRIEGFPCLMWRLLFGREKKLKVEIANFCVFLHKC